MLHLRFLTFLLAGKEVGVGSVLAADGTASLLSTSGSGLSLRERVVGFCTENEAVSLFVSSSSVLKLGGPVPSTSCCSFDSHLFFCKGWLVSSVDAFRFVDAIVSVNSVYILTITTAADDILFIYLFCILREKKRTLHFMWIGRRFTWNVKLFLFFFFSRKNNKQIIMSSAIIM